MNQRAAIYARYSSQHQKDASIEDQVELCRRYIEAKGWTIALVYDDRAISGASTARPGFQAMLSGLGTGKFDVVVSEALDRLGRKLADVAALYDQLQFQGIGLHTVATGEVTQLHVGMLGTMAQLYLSDLKDKTKRGQLGAVLKGRVPAGNAYGYDTVDGDPGRRQINQQQAAVVRRIFCDYAAGKSPRAIARTLNAESIPGPEGRPWRDTTIRGQVQRGTGLLNNALYVGRIEWNRCSYVKNPHTGKRIARPNPQSAWEVVDVPELRIVGDGAWRAVKERQSIVKVEMARDETGNALNRAHRRKYLLSGLIQCGTCGGHYTVVAQQRYGCATRRAMGSCANDRTISRAELEHRVLVGLRDRLMAPEQVQTFVDEFTREANRLLEYHDQDRRNAEDELGKLQTKIARIVSAIEDGGQPTALLARLAELERRQLELQAALKDLDQTPRVQFHPNLPELYARKVAHLEAALDDPAIKAEAGEALRSLIDKIVVSPREGGGAHLELYGDIAHILELGEQATSKKKRPGAMTPGRRLSVVAGVGFEPTTFRL